MPQVGEVNRFGGTLDAIAQIGREESKVAMAKQAKADFTEGVVAVTQGRTLTEIDNEQPWYNNVFGPSATMRGAESQTALDALNQGFGEEAEFIGSDTGRALDPDSYRQRLGGALKSMLTGNDRVDSLITADFTAKAGALSETQTKAHRAYVNEQNILTLGNTLSTQANNVESLATSNGWEHELVAEAKGALAQSLQNKPEGMNDASWRKLLVQSAVVNFKQGSDVMHRAITEMKVPFTPTETLTLIAAEQAFLASQDAGTSIEQEMDFGRIGAGVDQGVYGPAELLEQVRQHKEQFGESKDTTALFRKAFAVSEKAAADASDAKLLLTGRAGEIIGDRGTIDKARIQSGYRAAYTEIESRYDMQTPEGRAAAKRDKIMIWDANGPQDEQIKSRFSKLGDGTLAGGEVDPQYTDMYNEWLEYARVNPVKAADLLSGDEAKVQAETIKQLLEEGSIQTASDGVLMVQSMRRRGVDAAYLASSDFNSSLDSAVEDLAESKWSWFGFQQPQDASDNMPQISAFVRGKAKQLVARGYPLESAVATASKTFARNHDFINGTPVPNAGIDLATRMRLKGGSPQEAINFHMQAAGFTSDDFRVEAMSGEDEVIVSIADPDNPDYQEGLRTLSLRQIGNSWNNKVVLPPLEAEFASAARETTEDLNRTRMRLRNRKLSLGITTGLDTESLDRDIFNNKQRTEETRLMWREIIRGTAKLGATPGPVGMAANILNAALGDDPRLRPGKQPETTD